MYTYIHVFIFWHSAPTLIEIQENLKCFIFILRQLYPIISIQFISFVLDMNSVPPDAPTGLRLGVIGLDAISLKWERPKGLVSSYVVQYGPADANEDELREIKLQVGKLM